jgi:hypothetical protein
MATADRSLNAPTPSAPTARLLPLAPFVAAIILSASPLFMVQPMFTKLVLPRFGGAPWVCRILSGRPSRRLRICPLAHALCTRPAVGRRSSPGDNRRTLRAAVLDGRRLGPAASERASPLADRVVHGLDRLAVLRTRGQQPAASALVRAHQSSRRTRPPETQGPARPAPFGLSRLSVRDF